MLQRNNIYAVEAIRDERVPLEIIEKDLHFRMMQELENVLFSGEMVAIQIKKRGNTGRADKVPGRYKV